MRSPSTRRAWIEIELTTAEILQLESPSTRRAWIEIHADLAQLVKQNVALHPEGVDRNLGAFAMQEEGEKVALHPEGVDRNLCRH